MANKASDETKKNTGSAAKAPSKKKKKVTGKTHTRKVIARIFLFFGVMFSAVAGVMAANMVHRGERALGMINYDTGNTLSEVDLSKYKLASDTQIVNVLLVGVDKNLDEQDVDGAERRSDSMMIATMDIKHGKLKLTSLMRDMYVAVPGYGNQKLNAAYSYGGIQLLYETIAQNFGVRMDGYAEVNFDAFVNVIDLIGGIEVNLTQSESDNLNTTNYIKRKKYRNTKVGKQMFNGYQALGYCRIRHGKRTASGRYPGVYTASGKGDDYGRVERQRLTIQAIMNKVKKMSPTEMIDLAADVLPNVTTDITQDDIFSYLMTVVRMGTTKINQFSLPVDGSYSNQSVGGQQVLVTDITQNKSALKKFLFNS
ncbi:MAG: LCP family protein [Eubacterium sp.]|nr:LCP family protein [Eubacterium sp.]